MPRLKCGDRLKNDAVVITYESTDNSTLQAGYVLAFWNTEYVSWAIDDHGNTYSGEYLDNLLEAVERFNERVATAVHINA